MAMPHNYCQTFLQIRKFHCLELPKVVDLSLCAQHRMDLRFGCSQSVILATLSPPARSRRSRSDGGIGSVRKESQDLKVK